MHSSIKVVATLVAAAALLAACQPSTAEIDTTPTATASPTPTPTRRPFPDPGLALVGPTETVWDWTTRHCEQWDIPDLPARAFRDASGRVNLVISHTSSRRMTGPSLNELSYGCRVLMTSPKNPDPAMYFDYTWLASPYTGDGQTVYALVHNEFHGFERPALCPSRDYGGCWYNAVTLAVSHDGGASFAPAAAPPAHLVATIPRTFEDGAGPYGALEPGNIIKGPDGAYYAFVRFDGFRSDSQWMCLLRTTDLGTPTAWKAWGGRAYDVALYVNPYTHPSAAAGMPRCEPVDVGDLANLGANVTYNTYLERYVMVGNSGEYSNALGRNRFGVFYSLSDDLLDWTPKELLIETELAHTWEAGDPNCYAYPALIDPASESRNFETTGKTASLYLTRFNGGGKYLQGLEYADRDLVRIPVEFFPNVVDARNASVEFVP